MQWFRKACHGKQSLGCVIMFGIYPLVVVFFKEKEIVPTEKELHNEIESRNLYFSSLPTSLVSWKASF